MTLNILDDVIIDKCIDFVGFMTTLSDVVGGKETLTIDDVV